MSLSDVIENYQASFVEPSSLPSVYGEEHFPARYLSSDPKERRMMLKLNFLRSVSDNLKARLNVVYEPSEKELEVVKHFQGQLTQASLDQWVWAMHDPPRDPGMGWVFATNFPEQRQRMIDLLNLKHDILEQLMILKTKSFPDENDAILLFIINFMHPVERQRFLTWLVGNDKSETVLKSIVGSLPTFPRSHSTDINTLVFNAAGGSPDKYIVDNVTGNYPGDGRIPNRLWRRMAVPEYTASNNMVRALQGAENRNDISRLFAQLPLRGRNDYTLPTPYTANMGVIFTPQGLPLSLAPEAPTRRGEGLRDPLQSVFTGGRNVQDRIEHMMKGLNLNQANNNNAQ